jgi:hypothetical protein
LIDDVRIYNRAVKPSSRISTCHIDTGAGGKRSAGP